MGFAIDGWLRKMELQQYAAVFLDNEIDEDVLSTLTSDDLKEMGVLVLGHRRKLLNAIAALREDRSKAEAPHQNSMTAGTASSADGERRQLTVLFCDMVDSTALAARLDPEEFGIIIGDYQQTCSKIIKSWHGYTARYLSDGILAYFGWPQANEDDAERAVQAGLDLARAVSGMKAPGEITLAARVGIATGIVMIGDIAGRGDAGDETVVGQTPHLAARLQSVAQPGQVVVSKATYRLLGSGFDFVKLGRRHLKGFDKGARVYAVTGVKDLENRFEALRGPRLTPFVGRENELGILLERWNWAKAGDGQVVLLEGEAGIGKSRLVKALRERLSGETYTSIQYFCSPYHVASSLHPIIGQIEHAAGFTPEDSPVDRLDRLEKLVPRSTRNRQETMSLVASLMSVPAGDRYPAVEMTAPQRKLRTLEVIADHIALMAMQQPSLVVYEDLQWVDASTLELLATMIDRIRDLPVMIVVTFRPDFVPPWTGQSHVTMLHINRLGRRQSEEIVAHFTHGKALPEVVASQILAKTEGIPLFVEELTKTVLESGLLRPSEIHYELDGPLPRFAVPVSLVDSLAARLDRLAPVKEIAQIGAVIGRKFSYELMAAVADLPKAQLLDALDQLVEAELIFRIGDPPSATYIFKHALIRDAAYQSLLRSRRQQLHAKIARTLSSIPAGAGDNAPEILAHHYTRAGIADRAIALWRRAGALALDRSANVEAIAHFQNGLGLLEYLPDGAERDEHELALNLAVGSTSIALKGYSAPEVERSYRRAWELCERLAQPEQQFTVSLGLWSCYFVRGELGRAREHADRLVTLSRSQKSRLRRAHACRALGSTLFYFGRLDEAHAQLEQGLACEAAVEELSDHRAHLLLHGEHPGIHCRLYSAWTSWFLGYPDRALRTVQEAITLGERFAHVHSVALGMGFAAVLLTLRGDYEAAREQSAAGMELARKNNLPQSLAKSMFCHGLALIKLGDHQAGFSAMKEAETIWNGIGANLVLTQWYGFVAAAHIIRDEFVEANASLDRALEIAARSGESYYLAEIHRLRGVVRSRTGDEARADDDFGRALDLARKQSAKALELRASIDRARLWASRSEPENALRMLTNVAGWFTEGFETADLRAARDMIAQLSGRVPSSEAARI